MGRTYTVPRSAKGESRILYIFSVKSLAATAIGAVIGIPFYFIFSLVGAKFIGIIAIAICAVLGYTVEVLTIPDSPIFGNLRKAGGEKLRDILIRTLTFTKRKKIYIYSLKKNDLASKSNKINNVNKDDEENNNSVKTTEDNEKNNGEEI